MNWKAAAKQQIDEWETKFDELRVQLKLLEMEVRDEYDERMTALRRRWSKLQTEFDTWGDDAEERWVEWKESFGADIGAFEQNLSDIVDSDGSEGWVEGMGHKSAGEADFAKGQRDSAKHTDSDGWAEGMGNPDEGESDYAKGQRTQPEDPTPVA